MTITRIIDGKTVTIELTGIELFRAYCEQEYKFDRENILSVTELSEDTPDDIMHDIVGRYHKIKEWCDDGSWVDHAHDAVQYVSEHTDITKYLKEDK